MSYRTIFSVINEHTASTVAARYAISLAAACKAGLVLYAANTAESGENIRHRTDSNLDHLHTVATRLNISVTRIRETGNIGTLLPERAQSEKADLVLYPLTPYERYGATLQRHTVHDLLRSIRPDLAIIRSISMAKPHAGNILVPLGMVDKNRERLILFISELAGSFHSQVTLFHLFQELGATVMPVDIARFRNRLLQQNIIVLERSGKGQISKSITVEAITRHNDLIILGASDRGILRRILFGNPAGEIIQQSPCNTILFRAAL